MDSVVLEAVCFKKRYYLESKDCGYVAGEN
jgi:hypothetical protein